MKHPMYETVGSPSNWPGGGVNNFTADQIAQRSTWARVPDLAPSDLAQYHAIDMQRANGSTATMLNPLDPGTVDEVPGELGPGWLVTPDATIVPAFAGRR